MKVYGIKDKKLNNFIEYVTFQNNDVALRWFHDIINRGDVGVVSKYPDDFELWYCCDVNIYNGQVDDNSVAYIVDGGALTAAHSESDS